MVTHLGQKRVSRSTTPHPCSSYMRAHGMSDSDKILYDDQTRTTGKFYSIAQPPPPALAKNFCDTNADARSVCDS